MIRGSSNPSQDDRLRPASAEQQKELEQTLEQFDVDVREQQTRDRAGSMGLLYIDLSAFPIAPEALAFISEDVARDWQTLCFYFSRDKIKIAAVNPLDPRVINFYQRLKDQKPQADFDLYLISSNSFLKAFKLYKNLPRVKETGSGIKITAEDLERITKETVGLEDLKAKIKQVSISELITFIVATAIKVNASDIHVEAEEKDVKIRYRIDGVLQDIGELPRNLWHQLVTRIKLLAKLKINVEDLPQDGRISINLPGDRIDVRVSTLPTNYGESIVMRLLTSKMSGLEFEELGFVGRSYEIMKKEITRPNGMIITTGPTGSGKTTTLYAILKSLDKPGVKIITIEDPIEYQLAGIIQSQVDVEKGYTFAKSVRTLVRQDPDILMVGEIRDRETAEVAIQSALTGHLVVSTLHTNNAAAAIPRFLSMDVKPFLLSPALNVVIGQRLVRRLCNECKQEKPLIGDILIKAREKFNGLKESGNIPKEMKDLTFENLHLFSPHGCPVCNQLGYRGRMGIYEVLVVDPKIQKTIKDASATEDEIKQYAIKQGMLTMVEDGIIKAVRGLTSVDEVFRVAI